ncbi:MAG: hypothetical protein HON90_11740 [Halobacteriovoraceae bacterium]|jgi:hypothetical protein|nr:hypothetical protein [Halobacteriovoraceae bacterium]
MKVLYLGKDALFLTGLTQTFSEVYADSPINIHELFPEPGSFIGKFLPLILQEKSNIIIVDFSTDFELMRELAWQLSISLNPKDVTLVGVLDIPHNEESEHELDLVSLTQIPIIHYKGNDLKNIIFDAMYLTNFNNQARGEYATFSNPALYKKANYFSALTYILDNSKAIMESSVPLVEGDHLRLESDDLPAINNKYAKVIGSSNELLRTKFSNRYLLDLEFEGGEVQDISLERDDAPEEDEKETPTPEAISKVDLKDLKLNIEQLKNASKEGLKKLLMIQSNLDVLNQLSQPLIDYPYNIKFLTKFTSEMNLLKTFRPHLISVELTTKSAPKVESEEEKINDSEDTDEAGYSSEINLEDIKKLVAMIKSIDNYSPVINLFNCPKLTDDQMQALDYPMLMTINTKMTIELLIKMLEAIEKKNSEEVQEAPDRFLDGVKVPFKFKMLDKEVRVRHSIEIKITSLSEHEVTFISNKKLPEREILYTEMPAKFYFTVVLPIDTLEKSKIGNHYFALIHGITPSETQKLRSVVNELFFLELQEKKAEEKLAVEALKLQKKQEEKDAIEAAKQAEIQKKLDEEAEKKQVEEERIKAEEEKKKAEEQKALDEAEEKKAKAEASDKETTDAKTDEASEISEKKTK